MRVEVTDSDKQSVLLKNELIMTVKSFIVLAPAGADIIVAETKVKENKISIKHRMVKFRVCRMLHLTNSKSDIFKLFL